MRKLSVFNQVSLDGYIADRNGDMSCAHKSDPEWNEFVGANASSGGELLFGRKTYELMVAYWPTPMAAENDPVVAEGMNKTRKVVFSRTMKTALWTNTRLVKGDIATEVRKMKQQSGPPMVILGSGSIVAQLTEARLVDEYQIVVNPIVLGGGRSMFEGVREKVSLELTNTRKFGNGNVLLCHVPA